MDNISLNKEMNKLAGTKGIDYFNPETGLSNIFKYVVPEWKTKSPKESWAHNVSFMYDNDGKITCELGYQMPEAYNYDATGEGNTEAEALITACYKALIGV